MRAVCDMEMIGRFTCKCGASVDIKYALYRYCEIPMFVPPEGWRVLDGITFCPNHTLREEESHA